MRDRPVAETSTGITHNSHKRQTPMLPAEFEPVIPASGRKQNYALDGATANIGLLYTVGPK
jgi:hypothetical protein